MTAPAVVARTVSEQASDANSFTVGLGSPTAGELVVAIISIDGQAGAVWGVDKTVSGSNWWVATHLVSNSTVLGIVAIKVAEGGDALKLVAVDSADQQASAIVFRISGHGSYAGVGNSTNGDPPNVAITGSAQDCLFIAALCTDAQVVASAAPSTYGSLTTKAATNSTGASVSVADKAANATSDNPGTFTNNTEQWVAFTIAIPENNITTNARVTQAAVEAASRVDPNLIATQVALEVMSANSLNMIVTQIALETVTPQTQNMYATQVALEVLSGDPWPSLTNANKYRQIQIAC
jgi:hypothetical protein